VVNDLIHQFTHLTYLLTSQHTRFTLYLTLDLLQLFLVEHAFKGLFALWWNQEMICLGFLILSQILEMLARLLLYSFGCTSGPSWPILLLTLSVVDFGQFAITIPKFAMVTHFK
jgi:hypothetical protein